MDEYLRMVRATMSANTYRTYKAALESFGEDRSLSDVAEYIESQVGKSRRTIKHRLTIVAGYFAWRGEDVSSLLRLLRGYKAEETLQPCPSKAEVESILDGITNLKYRAIFLLAAECGLRVSEIISVRLSDYDGDNVVLRHTKNGKDYPVKLTTRARNALFLYLEEYSPATYLFEGRSGPLDVSAVQRYIKERMVAAGCGQYHMHSLRRYFANRLARSGVSPYVLQRCMRHQSLQSTQKYLNIDGQQAAAAVEEVFG